VNPVSNIDIAFHPEMTLNKNMHTFSCKVIALLSCLIAPGILIADQIDSTGEPFATHALLINGGGTPRINFQSHFLHIERIYGQLRDAGMPENQISIFSADGSDPEPDLAIREMQNESNFWLLAGTRLERVLRPRINYINSELPGATLQAATRDNLQRWFEKAADSLGEGDALLIYVTDHGTLNKEDPDNNRITLWGDGENIDVAEFQGLVNLLHPSVRVILLMSQCFSGSFANLIFRQAGDELPRPNLGGFFSSTADRPAYGCYRENRGKYNLGHSFRFFDALEHGGSFSDAHKEVLVTDRTPDVPLRASDFYLESIIKMRAGALGLEVDQLVDQLLKQAWQDKGAWETEIRLLDHLAETFGYFSPRYLSELAQHSAALSNTSKQLADYEAAWRRTYHSLCRENLERFLELNPEWESKLTKDSITALSASQRSDLTRELLADLDAFTERDKPTADRLRLLREKTETTAQSGYRLEVREGTVLRMRTILLNIAGRQYLSQRGMGSRRMAHANLVENEAAALKNASGSKRRTTKIEPFPHFEEEVKLAESALPGWMGIQFRPVRAEKRSAQNLGAGAVSVMAVFEDSPAQQAGLEVGDIIVGRPGQPFTERNYVREWVMTSPIGEMQSLQVMRGEEMLTVGLTPQAFPNEWPSLPGPPNLGNPAPPLDSLESFRGKPVAELTGQGPYLLFFWATWCGPCKAALPELMAFERGRSTPVLSITDETPELVENFLQKHKGPFPEAIALDEYRRSFMAYGVAGTPQFVLIDEHGNVSDYRIGYRKSEGLMLGDWAWEAEAATGKP
jgi:thiol-disulfide isomerase/thioredoxin